MQMPATSRREKKVSGIRYMYAFISGPGDGSAVGVLRGSNLQDPWYPGGQIDHFGETVWGHNGCDVEEVLGFHSPYVLRR